MQRRVHKTHLQVTKYKILHYVDYSRIVITHVNTDQAISLTVGVLLLLFLEVLAEM